MWNLGQNSTSVNQSIKQITICIIDIILPCSWLLRKNSPSSKWCVERMKANNETSISPAWVLSKCSYSNL